MDEQKATQRAEEIVHQAVDGMSPKPTLKRTGLRPLGTCVARDDHGPDDRVQFRLTYQLTGVPGSKAKTLVRQARDAWVKVGYKFQSSDADWSDPFPSVGMRTEPDDFWMTALTGVVNRAEGEGLAAISVTSPCFAPSGGSAADPAALQRTQADEHAEHRALDHSSRIYDALQARHATAQQGDGLSTYQDSEGAYVHHAWSTQPLTEEETVRVMARAQTYFESAGWTVRHVPTEAGIPAIVARNAKDESVAQVAPSTIGAVRVAVTTPSMPEDSAMV
ncbi:MULTISPECIES: hypothetical protein [unclassified Streptomyces]|uniref:hypothetical protein n=1 Tax=unclassified Streptomyces TaxID=2593676 RepID=UPI002365C2BC|nr:MULTISPECIES: hypothetical protein [unclassified Streptomyces]MDF3141212.1 hypothetical protein [Streptomyces sp. T21Q-yed]WDF40914.1 hypothetical protein PBV52_31120 [Streptomyces sp. T12]